MTEKLFPGFLTVRCLPGGVEHGKVPSLRRLHPRPVFLRCPGQPHRRPPSAASKRSTGPAERIEYRNLPSRPSCERSCGERRHITDNRRWARCVRLAFAPYQDIDTFLPQVCTTVTVVNQGSKHASRTEGELSLRLCQVHTSVEYTRSLPGTNVRLKPRAYIDSSSCRR